MGEGERGSERTLPSSGGMLNFLVCWEASWGHLGGRAKGGVRLGKHFSAVWWCKMYGALVGPVVVREGSLTGCGLTGPQPEGLSGKGYVQWNRLCGEQCWGRELRRGPRGLLGVHCSEAGTGRGAGSTAEKSCKMSLWKRELFEGCLCALPGN